MTVPKWKQSLKMRVVILNAQFVLARTMPWILGLLLIQVVCTSCRNIQTPSKGSLTPETSKLPEAARLKLIHRDGKLKNKKEVPLTIILSTNINGGKNRTKQLAYAIQALKGFGAKIPKLAPLLGLTSDESREVGKYVTRNDKTTGKLKEKVNRDDKIQLKPSKDDRVAKTRHKYPNVEYDDSDNHDTNEAHVKIINKNKHKKFKFDTEHLEDYDDEKDAMQDEKKHFNYNKKHISKVNKVKKNKYPELDNDTSEDEKLLNDDDDDDNEDKRPAGNKVNLEKTTSHVTEEKKKNKRLDDIKQGQSKKKYRNKKTKEHAFKLDNVETSIQAPENDNALDGDNKAPLNNRMEKVLAPNPSSESMEEVAPVIEASEKDDMLNGDNKTPLTDGIDINLVPNRSSKSMERDALNPSSKSVDRVALNLSDESIESVVVNPLSESLEIAPNLSSESLERGALNPLSESMEKNLALNGDSRTHLSDNMERAPTPSSESVARSAQNSLSESMVRDAPNISSESIEYRDELNPLSESMERALGRKSQSEKRTKIRHSIKKVTRTKHIKTTEITAVEVNENPKKEDKKGKDNVKIINSVNPDKISEYHPIIDAVFEINQSQNQEDNVDKDYVKVINPVNPDRISEYHPIIDAVMHDLSVTDKDDKPVRHSLKAEMVEKYSTNKSEAFQSNDADDNDNKSNDSHDIIKKHDFETKSNISNTESDGSNLDSHVSNGGDGNLLKETHSGLSNVGAADVLKDNYSGLSHAEDGVKTRENYSDLTHAENGDVSKDNYSGLSHAEDGDKTKENYSGLTHAEHGDVSKDNYSGLSHAEDGDKTKENYSGLTHAQHGDVSKDNYSGLSHAEDGVKTKENYTGLKHAKDGDVSKDNYSRLHNADVSNLANARHTNVSKDEDSDVDKTDSSDVRHENDQVVKSKESHDVESADTGHESINHNSSNKDTDNYHENLGNENISKTTEERMENNSSNNEHNDRVDSFESSEHTNSNVNVTFDIDSNNNSFEHSGVDGNHHPNETSAKSKENNSNSPNDSSIQQSKQVISKENINSDSTDDHNSNEDIKSIENSDEARSLETNLSGEEIKHNNPDAGSESASDGDIKSAENNANNHSTDQEIVETEVNNETEVNFETQEHSSFKNDSDAENASTVDEESVDTNSKKISNEDNKSTQGKSSDIQLDKISQSSEKSTANYDDYGIIQDQRPLKDDYDNYGILIPKSDNVDNVESEQHTVASRFDLDNSALASDLESEKNNRPDESSMQSNEHYSPSRSETANALDGTQSRENTDKKIDIDEMKSMEHKSNDKYQQESLENQSDSDRSTAANSQSHVASDDIDHFFDKENKLEKNSQLDVENDVTYHNLAESHSLLQENSDSDVVGDKIQQHFELEENSPFGVMSDDAHHNVDELQVTSLEYSDSDVVSDDRHHNFDKQSVELKENSQFGVVSDDTHHKFDKVHVLSFESNSDIVSDDIDHHSNTESIELEENSHFDVISDDNHQKMNELQVISLEHSDSDVVSDDTHRHFDKESVELEENSQFDVVNDDTHQNLDELQVMSLEHSDFDVVSDDKHHHFDKESVELEGNSQFDVVSDDSHHNFDEIHVLSLEHSDSDKQSVGSTENSQFDVVNDDFSGSLIERDSYIHSVKSEENRDSLDDDIHHYLDDDSLKSIENSSYDVSGDKYNHLGKIISVLSPEQSDSDIVSDNVYLDESLENYPENSPVIPTVVSVKIIGDNKHRESPSIQDLVDKHILDSDILIFPTQKPRTKNRNKGKATNNLIKTDSVSDDDYVDIANTNKELMEMIHDAHFIDLNKDRKNSESSETIILVPDVNSDANVADFINKLVSRPARTHKTEKHTKHESKTKNHKNKVKHKPKLIVDEHDEDTDIHDSSETIEDPPKPHKGPSKKYKDKVKHKKSHADDSLEFLNNLNINNQSKLIKSHNNKNGHTKDSLDNLSENAEDSRDFIKTKRHRSKKRRLKPVDHKLDHDKHFQPCPSEDDVKATNKQLPKHHSKPSQHNNKFEHSSRVLNHLKKNMKKHVNGHTDNSQDQLAVDRGNPYSLLNFLPKPLPVPEHKNEIKSVKENSQRNVKSKTKRIKLNEKSRNNQHSDLNHSKSSPFDSDRFGVNDKDSDNEYFDAYDSAGEKFAHTLHDSPSNALNVQNNNKNRDKKAHHKKVLSNKLNKDDGNSHSDEGCSDKKIDNLIEALRDKILIDIIKQDNSDDDSSGDEEIDRSGSDDENGRSINDSNITHDFDESGANAAESEDIVNTDIQYNDRSIETASLLNDLSNGKKDLSKKPIKFPSSAFNDNKPIVFKHPTKMVNDIRNKANSDIDCRNDKEPKTKPLRDLKFKGDTKHKTNKPLPGDKFYDINTSGARRYMYKGDPLDPYNVQIRKKNKKSFDYDNAIHLPESWYLMDASEDTSRQDEVAERNGFNNDVNTMRSGELMKDFIKGVYRRRYSGLSYQTDIDSTNSKYSDLSRHTGSNVDNNDSSKVGESFYDVEDVSDELSERIGLEYIEDENGEDGDFYRRMYSDLSHQTDSKIDNTNRRNMNSYKFKLKLNFDENVDNPKTYSEEYGLDDVDKISARMSENYYDDTVNDDSIKNRNSRRHGNHYDLRSSHTSNNIDENSKAKSQYTPNVSKDTETSQARSENSDILNPSDSNNDSRNINTSKVPHERNAGMKVKHKAHDFHTNYADSYRKTKRSKKRQHNSQEKTDMGHKGYNLSLTFNNE